MAALVLARLDCAMIVAGLLGAQLVWAALRRDRLLAAAAVRTGAVVAVVVACYLAWNLAYAGAALPVSGTLKTTFPRPTLGNARDIRNLLSGEDAYALLRVYRQAPVVLSAIAAVCWLAGVVRRPRLGDPASSTARWRVALTGTALGVVTLDAYDFFFVPGSNQGHWYFPIQLLFISLAALEWAARVRALDRPAIAALAAAVSVVAFLGVGRSPDHHERFAAFWYDEAPRVRAFYGNAPPRLLAVDDGIDAFALGFPSMSALGLMIDADAVDAVEQKRVVRLALARGFDRISSVAYADGKGLTAASSSDDVRSWVAGLLPGDDLSGLTFTVEYASQPFATAFPGGDGRYLIIRVR
jgi:hypothetical protein